MPVTTLGAAAVGGGLHSIWHYNRANYMFDIPLKQSRYFQAQNIMLARFQLFREDVRDLASVTIGKVRSYMIVNTLKLGFIIAVFFKFERTDIEGDLLGHEENQVAMIFSVTLTTALFWLITSIWFSMHALILSQTLMTKMLLQVARIPLPTDIDISEAAPDSRAFEKNFGDAFRLPFLQETRWNHDHGSQTHPRQRGSAARGPSPTGSVGSTDLPPSTDTLASAGKYMPFRGWLGSPRRRGSRDRDEEVTSQPSLLPPNSASQQNAQDGGQDRRPVTIQELLEGVVRGCNVKDSSFATNPLDPHIKLFKLLRISWAPYDLYAKVAMELGTACLLSGLAFFAIYYLRDGSSPFHVQDPAWVSFMTLSVLAWWSSILDMTLPVWGHVVLALLMMGGPTCVFVNYAFTSRQDSPERHWALFRAFAFQTAWVMVLMWSAFGVDGKWPRLWRASLFLNVLHAEEGPRPFKKDVASSKFLGPRQRRSRKDSDSDSNVSSDTDSVSIASADDLWKDDGQENWRAQLAAGPLLRCLDAAICIRKLKQGPMRRKLRRVRDKLYEACRASGALNLETVNSLPVEGFWLRLEGADRRRSLHWVSPSGAESQPVNYDTALEMQLEDIMAAARGVAAMLHEQSYKWTEEDMRRMEAYGGEALPGLRSFIAQFRQSGSITTCGLGSEGTHIFRGGVLLNTLLWVVAFSWSWTRAFQYAEELGQNVSNITDYATLSGFTDYRRLGSDAPSTSRIPFRAPPWLALSAIGCDARIEQIALADDIGVFVVNRTGAGRAGPFEACASGAAPAAAAFDGDGRIWAACDDSLQMLRRPGDDAPARSVHLRVRGLQALALDPLPSAGGDRLDGIAVLGGRLLAMQSDPKGGWSLAGTLSAPGGRRWIAVALRNGRGLALDADGWAFELDSGTGRWLGPFRLPSEMRWKGVCALPGSDGWLVAGQPPIDRGGPVELWRLPLRRGAAES